jgi:hypothetical protein
MTVKDHLMIWKKRFSLRSSQIMILTVKFELDSRSTLDL